MSHKASSWLAEIPAAALSGSEFRVLFHLCDAHNSKRHPDTACFPSQEKLREATGLSNGGLNNALNALEEAGFIRRRRTTEPGTSVQRTYYILGCDFDHPQEQTPENGVRANSTFRGANSTFQGGKLHSSGEYPVSNHKEEPARAPEARVSASSGRRQASSDRPDHRSPQTPALAPSRSSSVGSDDLGAHLQTLAEWINSGRHFPPSACSNTQRDALLARGLVTAERLRALQIY